MKSVKILICLATISSAIFQSCIKEKDCPVAPAIYVSIEDTSYDNAADIPLARAANDELPFRNYVSTLNIEYLHLNSSVQTPIQRLVSVADDVKRYTLPKEQLTDGDYRLTIIGNQPSTPAPSNEYPLILHPDGSEYMDIYIGRETLRFPITSDNTIPLRRTKGKLTVLCTDFPADVARVDIRITNLYNALDNNLAYIGNTQVTKSFILPSPSQASNQFDLVLAPTVDNTSSEAFLTLYDANGDVIVMFSNINLTIKRNQISVINIIYDPDTENWEIWITADGVWVRVHDLEIQ